jgi:CheY-like chemotaxis protein/HPt (histidine-containing phosphotransfer) domain-containing protein
MQAPMISEPVSTLENPIGKSLARQLASKDVEIQIAVLRCGVLLLAFVGLLGVTVSGWQALPSLSWLRLTTGLFLLASIGLLGVLARHPKRRGYQLVLCVLLDIGGASCLAFFLDHSAVAFYSLGLCLVIAYGLRYGTGMMLVSLSAFVTGFGTCAWTQSRLAADSQAGPLLLACMALTAIFVHTHHVRLAKRRVRLQSEITAHADFIAVLGDELSMSLDRLVGGTQEKAEKSGSLDLPHYACAIVSHFLRPLPSDILDYCAVKRGMFSVTTQDFNLFESIHHTLLSFQRHAPEREQRILLQVDPTIAFALHGDAARMRRALLHVLCDTLSGCGAGQFLIRLTGENDCVGQLILRLGLFRAEASNVLPANRNSRPAGGHALPVRAPTGLAGRMAVHLVSALGGELVRRPLTERHLVELSLPLGRQGARVRQGTLDGMEALAIGFEEGSLMRLCTQLERWSAVTLSAVDVTSAGKVLSDTRLANRQVSLILLHADALRIGSDGNDSGPNFARDVAEATVHLRSWCAPGASIVLCVQGQVRSSMAGLLDAAPELLSVLDSPIEPEELFNLASAAHAGWGAEVASGDIPATAPTATGMPARPAANSSILTGYPPPGGAGASGILWASHTVSPLPIRPDSGQPTYRILLAESNPTNAMVLRKIVERGGHYCEVVSDGVLALDRLTSDHFDAAVLDENLPVMNGYELAKAYRYIAHPDERAAIILCTADTNPDVGSHCEPGVVAAFVSFAVSAPALLGELDRVIASAMEESPYEVPAMGYASDAEIMHPVTEDHRELDHDVLAELEEISPDPAFLDRLLNGFVHDNRAMLDRLHDAVQADRNEEARQLLHAIKGSAVSVGAIALKDLCCHLEKLVALKLPNDSKPMMARLETGFRQFCDALDNWRANRKLRVPR